MAYSRTASTTLVTLLLLVVGFAGAQASPDGDGRLLVKFKNIAGPSAVETATAAIRAQVIANLPHSGIKVLRVSEFVDADEALRLLRSRPDVQYAEVDRLVPLASTPNDPMFADQWHLPKIEAPAAWDRSVGSASIIIAICDTGVDSTHPDLTDRIVPGWNVASNNADTADVHGHGTMVAGCASASSNNLLGIASVSWTTRLMPVRVSEANGSAYFSKIAEGVTWARNNGARVANISYVATSSYAVTTASRAFTEAGGVVVSAAGNDGLTNGTLENPWIVTVSATTPSDVLAPWSSRGAFVDVSAPGEGITSTTRGGGYGGGSGTSFSSPIVAGVAALVLSANPALTGLEAAAILRNSADDKGDSGWDPLYGMGRINADRAVTLATSQEDLTPPTASFTSPLHGTTVSGTRGVTIAATDNVGVTSVEFFVDMVPQGTRTSAPYTFSWNTAQVANGGRILTATAYDAAGNSMTTQVTVTVSNDVTAPVVSFTSPSNGSNLGNTVNVQIAASDSVRVTSVEFRVDGVLVGSKTSAPYTFSWNTNQVANGSRALTAIARDAAGNAGTAQIVATVFNDSTPPGVAFTSPTNGATVSGSGTVLIAASDNVGVTSVQFRIDGVVVGTKTSAPYTFAWNTGSATNGSHNLSATATDAAGNSASTQIVVTVNNSNTDTTPPTVRLTSPTNNFRIGRTVTVRAHARDNVRVVKVELYVDGALAATSLASPFTTRWVPSRTLPGGPHTLQLKAYDAAGNVGWSLVVTVRK